jgi:putative transposase
MLTWAHYEFQTRLKWKAKVRGREHDVFIVDEHSTSVTCGQCGVKKEGLGGNKTFKCDHCGLVVDRDLNAARNILIKNMGFCGVALKEIISSLNGFD